MRFCLLLEWCLPCPSALYFDPWRELLDGVALAMVLIALAATTIGFSLELIQKKGWQVPTFAAKGAVSWCGFATPIGGAGFVFLYFLATFEKAYETSSYDPTPQAFVAAAVTFALASLVPLGAWFIARARVGRP